MKSSPLILLAMLFISLAVPLIAVAQDARDAAIKCNSHTPADIIAGCTVVINAGQETPRHLAMAYIYRGAAYADQGEDDKAISDYTQAIRLSPTDPTAYFDRGIEYASTGKYDLSIKDFTQAISLKPDFGRAYLDRGKVYQATGDSQRAQADFEKARSLGEN
jgi:tetratricopeptide (TPR) repeat protein